MIYFYSTIGEIKSFVLNAIQLLPSNNCKGYVNNLLTIQSDFMSLNSIFIGICGLFDIHIIKGTHND
jgi:hypothetical protein